MAMLSRQEAASQLVDGAIGAWFEDRYACAITLAGAAETGMPKIEGGASMFDAMRLAVMSFGKLSEREAADLMNNSRNWLKHFGEDKPEQISDDFAWIYVLRAYWQFRIVYQGADLTPNMVRFQAEIDEQVRPVREAVEAFKIWVRGMAEAIARMLPPPKP